MAAQTLQSHACTPSKGTVGIQASASSKDCQPCRIACISSSGTLAFRGNVRERGTRVTASNQTSAGLGWKPEPEDALRVSVLTGAPSQQSPIGSLSSSSFPSKPQLRSVDCPTRKASRQLQNGRSNHIRRSRLRAQTEESKELETEKPSTTAPASIEPPFYSRPSFWVQSALVLFTLAYIDAAFSGDWSRIGVLSKETEANLRIGAYVVVPLSLTGAWWLGKIIKSYGSPRTR